MGNPEIIDEGFKRAENPGLGIGFLYPAIEKIVHLNQCFWNIRYKVLLNLDQQTNYKKVQ